MMSISLILDAGTSFPTATITRKMPQYQRLLMIYHLTQFSNVMKQLLVMVMTILVLVVGVQNVELVNQQDTPLRNTDNQLTVEVMDSERRQRFICIR